MLGNCILKSFFNLIIRIIVVVIIKLLGHLLKLGIIIIADN